VKSHLTPAQELRRRAMRWAVKLRVNPRVVHVREMRRKWGSCSVLGTITLSWDLTREDARFQDYVVVHELLHLRVGSHGRVFKALMSAHVPDWQIFVHRDRHSGN
jgi:predicted metal-dependent hydrolase